MPCNDAPADNSGVLKRLLVQEFSERGDVEADEATPTFPDNAVLEEAAFGYLRDPAGARIGQHREQKLNVFIGKLSIGRFERSPMPCFSSCLKMPFMHVRQLPWAS